MVCFPFRSLVSASMITARTTTATSTTSNTATTPPTIDPVIRGSPPLPSPLNINGVRIGVGNVAEELVEVKVGE